MVVILSVVPTVEYSVFLFSLLLLVLTGAMALLYYIASYYYAYRGGYCRDGDLCGIFFFHVHNVSTSVSWGIGAALSFSNHMKTIK